ncbi:hypothetical protein TcBrA4_0104950 [Trypanosoma cruzi]|nr:hypothetical protein TcBrA4_0104950 [Trypanosoma cruzi]
MKLIRKRRSTVVRRITDIPALGQLYEESKRGRSRDVGAVNVGAWNVPSGAIPKLLPHVRTADERGELCGLFDGNIRCGAIDPTAVRQDAAVYVGNGSNPAGDGDSGVTKSCGTIGTKQARPLTKEGMNQVIRSRTDWKERVVVRLAWITASRWSEIAALTPNNSTLEADGTLILDWSVAPKTARADPHRALRFVRIREQDAFDIIKLCRTLQENEKLTNLTTAHVGRVLAPWDATAHSIKRGALRHAAQIVETHNLDPHGDLAVGEARQSVRPSPEYCSIFGEVHHNADPGVVSGRIDVKGETAEGQEPWLRAEERFSMIFITIMLLQ